MSDHELKELRDRVTASIAFARRVETLLDEAQDVIGARAMQTGQPRLRDMAIKAAKLCADARDMQAPIDGDLAIRLAARIL